MKAAQIDALRPEVACEVRVQGAAGEEWKPCGSDWTRGTVRLTASDDHSGVAYLNAAVWRDGTLLPDLVKPIEAVPERHRKSVQLAADGRFDIGMCAADRVGNLTGGGRATDCAVNFRSGSTRHRRRSSSCSLTAPIGTTEPE